MNKNVNLSIEEKAKKFDEAISSKKGLSKFLFENWWNEESNYVDMTNLIFPSNVNISSMKVKGNLIQDHQTANDIYQSHHKANYIKQVYQTTRYLFQDHQEVSGDFFDQKLKEDEEWRDWGGGDCVKRAKKLDKIDEDEPAF